MNKKQLTNFCIIPHNTKKSILAKIDENGIIELPSIDSYDNLDDEKNIKLLINNIREKYKIEIKLFWYINSYIHQQEDFDRLIIIPETYNDSKEELHEYQWIDYNIFEHSKIESSFLYDFISHYFEIYNDNKNTKIRWFKKGWFKEAEDWVLNVCRANNFEINRNFQQVRYHELSCIFNIVTDKGIFYYKESAPYNLKEGYITSLYNKILPSNTPKVIALDENRKCFLIEELKGNLFFECKDKNKWEQAFKIISNSHKHFFDQNKKLLEAGINNHTFDEIISSLNHIIPYYLSNCILDEEIAIKWKQSENKIINCIDKIKQLNIPDTLIHGDFHPGNIVDCNDKIMIFDFGLSSVAHPFLDTAYLFDLFKIFSKGKSVDELSPNSKIFLNKDNEDKFKSVYLRNFHNYASEKELLIQYEFAKPISILNRILFFYKQNLFSDELLLDFTNKNIMKKWIETFIISLDPF